MRQVNAETQRVTPRGPEAGPAVGLPERAGAVGRGAVLRRLVVPAGVLAAVVGAFAYVGAVDPNEPGHYPVCPLLRYTGLYCPGCGGLRGAHALLHGDLATALTNNALAVLGYLVFAAVWTVWAVRSMRGRPVRIELGPVHLWTAGALLLAFTVVRNLPFGGWLRP
ncbi:DUF2752 domain-containing protein [Streptomyces sp. SD15]